MNDPEGPIKKIWHSYRRKILYSRFSPNVKFWTESTIMVGRQLHGPTSYDLKDVDFSAV